MKKALSLNGTLALLTFCGLVAVRLLPGLSSSRFSYAVDASIVVVLLAFSDQIIQTALFFAIQLGKTVQLLYQAMAFYTNRLIRLLQKVAHSNESTTSDVLNPLLIALLLIVAGLLSPSDGVDSGLRLSPYDLLVRASIILAVSVGSFFVYVFWDSRKQDYTRRSGLQKENLSKPDENRSSISEPME
ncbi:hypothetical protein GCM10028803_11710 [Larkinella knui]|uniref:Uncharacterized protein n=1 Tax=Larkinella knui TaxID=2025310 RepID=A0A3P1CCQ2_9BACT|nr:hypothetical protein [Larkinella knui]RRB10866.1 hypothetical protein EHT87_27360 [Larkinella knui]